MFYLTVLEWIQPVMVEKIWGQEVEASVSILGTDHISSTTSSEVLPPARPHLLMAPRPSDSPTTWRPSVQTLSLWSTFLIHTTQRAILEQCCWWACICFP